MIIDCVSDLHGHYPKLEGGDLLIVAGNVSNNEQYDRFFDWLALARYKKKVYIAGNHDNYLFEGVRSTDKHCDATYLCDSGTEFEYMDSMSNPFPSDTCDCPCAGGKNIPRFNHVMKKLKIWGSPWTKRFKGMNPHCMAFTVDTEEELAAKWALIPDDVDILVTHSPPFHGALYAQQNPCESFAKLDRTVLGEHVGSLSLLKACDPDAGLRLHVFGHVHEGYGHYHEVNPIFAIDVVNASHVNERYEPVNKPIRIQL